MKNIFVLLGGVLLAGRLQADPLVNWVSDSYSSFDVILSGTGLGWSGTVFSPSGLWQLASFNNLYYPFPGGNPDVPMIEMNSSGIATYLGQLPSYLPPPDPSGIIHTVSINAPPGNTSFYHPTGPCSDPNPMNYGYLCELSFYGSYQNWWGISDFSVTSIPNVNDPSTWTWTAEYKASGESLGLAPVPEPGVFGLTVLSAGLGLLVWVRRKAEQPKLARIRVSNVIREKKRGRTQPRPQ